MQYVHTDRVSFVDKAEHTVFEVNKVVTFGIRRWQHCEQGLNQCYLRCLFVNTLI